MMHYLAGRCERLHRDGHIYSLSGLVVERFDLH
jgi:hypothetical protein